MANKSLFQSATGKALPATDALNHHLAPAYAFTSKHALAQYASTGCLNGTFYAGAAEQLSRVLELACQVEPAFVAKTAIYCRERGLMKDMPAVLTAALSVLDSDLLVKVFPRVIDNGKMLRNFVQVMRSGQVARKSLGSRPKRLVRQWLAARSDEALFKDSVGQSPSMADVVKMVHPRPETEARKALYAYLIGRAHDAKALPKLVTAYEDFKAGRTREVPDVPFQMLTSLELGRPEWTAIARSAPWQMTRMNLNTFARHGVFDSRKTTELVAERLRDREQVRKARVFPYQLMSAHNAAGEDVPREVRDALHDAMEAALGNIPKLDGQVVVCPDVSGSMQSPVTGVRQGATTAVRCVDVAALVAAAFMRKNPGTMVLPFEQDVVRLRLEARDTVMTNARKLAAVGGGGTNCSAPLARLNAEKVDADLVVFVSDNESWVDARAGRGTATMVEWNEFRERNPDARLVCIDLQPYGTTQAAEREDILNVGGFSDQVFEVVAEFAAGRLGADHWVGVIEKVQL
ncbi:MAG: TROVE domain-containing protein [Deltaproteobacteria bacterium]|nr:TROVE domain-containing protein [Deltaproteobacteria bacterium]